MVMKGKHQQVVLSQLLKDVSFAGVILAPHLTLSLTDVPA